MTQPTHLEAFLCNNSKAIAITTTAITSLYQIFTTVVTTQLQQDNYNGILYPGIAISSMCLGINLTMTLMKGDTPNFIAAQVAAGYVAAYTFSFVGSLVQSMA